MSFNNWDKTQYYDVGDIVRSLVDGNLYEGTALSQGDEPSTNTPVPWKAVPSGGGGVDSVNAEVGDIVLKGTVPIQVSVPTPGSGDVFLAIDNTSYVASVNGVAGAITIGGDNGLTETTSGQKITLHGTLLNLECKDANTASISNTSPTSIVFGTLTNDVPCNVCVSLSIQITPTTNNNVDTTFEIIVNGGVCATMVQHTGNYQNKAFTVPISAHAVIPTAGVPFTVELSAVQNGSAGDITFDACFGFAFCC